MTDDEKKEIKKMISDAIAEEFLRLRQEIVNARRDIGIEIDKIKKTLKMP